MYRPFRFAAFLLGVACVAAPSPSQGQDKKWVPAVELTDKAGKTWLLKEAKVGTKMASDRDYLLATLPKEIEGGTLVLRTSDQLNVWLTDVAVKTKKDGTVYALIQTKYLGKDRFGEVDQSLLKKDGWMEVEGKVATTFPSGEKWEWKAFKKDVKAGEVILQLENLSWNKKAPVLFIFK